MKLTDRKNAKELDFEQDGYPVRYAIMDIKEGEKSLCYVSAKCYQIAQQEVTSPTGKKLIGYDVVFDWDVSGKENIQYRDKIYATIYKRPLSEGLPFCLAKLSENLFCTAKPFRNRKSQACRN